MAAPRTLSGTWNTILPSNSSDTSDSTSRFSFRSSYRCDQMCLVGAWAQFCRTGKKPCFPCPMYLYTTHSIYAWTKIKGYLHFMTLGLAKILKHIGQVISVGSALPSLTYRDSLSQQPEDLGSMIWSGRSGSESLFPMGWWGDKAKSYY